MSTVILARILEAQGFITRRLQDLSNNLFTQSGWNQRRTDWESEFYYLAAYARQQRFLLRFSFEELMTAHGSASWERVLLDKIDWFIDRVRSELGEAAGRAGPDEAAQSGRRLTALDILRHAEFNYMHSSRKWAVCGWRQIMYVVVKATLSVPEARDCMDELWAAFLALRERYVKIYAVLDLNRMDISTEEFRHYMKDNWVHLLDRRDLVVAFVERNALKKAIWSSIAFLLGRPGRVRLCSTSDIAFAWVRRQMTVNGQVTNGR